MRARVTDARGNAVVGQTVTFAADNGATLTTVIGTTGTDGIATATLTSTRAGTSVVTATVNCKDQIVNTLFIANHSTATISRCGFYSG